MQEKKRDAASLKLLGGRLCLDYVNTLDWRGTANPHEFLNTYQDLVDWSRHVGICTRQEAGQLIRGAGQSVADAKMVLSRAIELRETIYRLFSANIFNRKPLKKDLLSFNKYISRSMGDSQIVRVQGTYAWDHSGNKTKLDWILNPIIRSMADILVSDELRKIKACADSACGWLFIDVSRNQSRRWCDMKDCGNRAKAMRFYQKKRTRLR
jgi:predicted RNA-binding Zn ribbon-like protein